MKKTSVAAGLLGLATLIRAHAAPDLDWPSYNGPPSGDRFSAAEQIRASNVKDLHEACEIDLGDAGALQTGPVVVDTTLYVTTTHTVAALDATDCSLRWRSVYEASQEETWPVNRGVAYLDGRIFRGTADGRLIALDAATGKELWRTKVADPSVGEFVSAAPIAWNGLVIIGPGGSDYGIQGRILALDATSGKEVWRFNLIPAPGEPGYNTWRNPDSAKHGGGATWSSFSLDPQSGELFVPVANPAPAYRADQRPGANLYTDSVVVLNVRTGALAWYYQLQSNDAFDYDVAAAPILYEAGGHRLVAVAGKDGFLYILDRESHRLIKKTAVTTILTPPTGPTQSGVLACPGTVGGVQWNGPAYSPETHLLYVGSVDWCWYYYSAEAKYAPGMSFMGSAPIYKPGKSRTGWIYAVDGVTGKPIWHYHADSPVLSGATPTAGGIVLSGESSGDLLVFEAKHGALLRRINLGGSLGGGIITYAVSGNQYVATTAGNISRAGLSSPGSLEPRLVILTTGPLAANQPTKLSAFPPSESGRTAYGVDQGKAIFNSTCATCHGIGGAGGESGPSLLGIGTRRDLPSIVDAIKNPAPPMPKLSPPLLDADVQALARYVAGFKQ